MKLIFENYLIYMYKQTLRIISRSGSFVIIIKKSLVKVKILGRESFQEIVFKMIGTNKAERIPNWIEYLK